MRKKFKIMYPADHPDENKRGKQYRPPRDHIIMMSSSGIFFLYCSEPYVQYARRLYATIGKYDVVWY